MFKELIRGFVAILAGGMLLAHGSLSLVDAYFGQSDVFSQALGAFVLALAPAVLASIAVLAAVRKADAFGRLGCSFAAGAMLATFVRWAARPVIGMLPMPAGPSGAWLAAATIQTVVYVLLALGLAVLVARRADRTLLKRVFAVGVVLVMLPLAALAREAVADADDKPGGRKLVLIVLDRFPSQYLPGYGAGTAAELPAFARKGRIFPGSHTSATFTYGFFGALYGGSLATAYDGERAGAPERRRNLPRLLQEAGVDVWISADHRSATPEGSGAHARHYRGLRSELLPQLPVSRELLRWFDVPVHTVNPGLLFRALGRDPKSERGVLGDTLLPALREAAGEPGDAFLVFHTDWRLGMSVPEKLWGEGASEEEGRSADAVRTRVQKRNYRYEATAEETAFAAAKRAEMQAEMPRVVGALDAFFAAAEQEGLLENTLVIVTSDHGAMSDKGRIWYGYHPNEEVTRTLLFIYGVEPGVDSRLVDTLDLSETIAAYFGVAGFADPAVAESLLSRASQAQSYSLTTAAKQFKERFLVIYRGDRKAVFNIAPDGAGEASAFEVRDGYREVPVGNGSVVASEYADSIADALKRFGIPPGDTHPRYRSR